jgi:riboflavin synthase
VFTGLIADLGHVARVDATPDGVRLTVESPLARELGEGESVAVNGVCLTAAEVGGDRFGADVMHETLRRSSLGGVAEGSRVNLELPLRADARLGGHMVQGHVDGVGRIRERTGLADGSTRVGVTTPAHLLRYVVEKGSIAVDGVSLTVAGLSGEGFDFALIPHTASVTTLGTKGVGSPVNLEVDLVAKYVERLAGPARGG